MTPWIDVATGSVVGRDHGRTGKNNQDALAYVPLQEGIVAVVCDGCGSQPHSEVGAQLGAQLLTQAVARQLTRTALTDAAFWPAVQRQLVVGYLLKRRSSCLSPRPMLTTANSPRFRKPPSYG
jgi:serine/threonine protein phosphatase PrpC